MSHFIGAHTIDTGGLDQAVRRAIASRMDAMQLFSAVPQYYNEKASIKPERVERFRSAAAAGGLDLSKVIVHAGFTLNAASPEPDKAEKSANALRKELERSTALGVLGCCFHPGSAGTGDVESAIARVGDAVTRALEAVANGGRVLIENTAGAGKTVGKTPAEIAGMLARVPGALRARTGYGLDTCHLFSAGHDIRASPSALRGVLDAFADATGENPSFFHLNDSQFPFASNRDRHALIGDGEIGIDPFRWLLADPRTEGIPLILETPQAHPAIAADDASADPWDEKMMGLLRELLPQQRGARSEERGLRRDEFRSEK